MILVLSGEGPTDLGWCRTAVGPCSGDDFSCGPLAVLLDRLLEPTLGYRPIETSAECVCFVPKAVLLQRQKQRKARGSIALTGKKRGQETGYFFTNAWMLGEMAIEQEQARQDRSIAVLHRDSDPTGSTAPSEWGDKFRSMQNGFLRAGHDRGVPMLPRPISEAWLLCVARYHPSDAMSLEEEAGNAHAANPLKAQLASALNPAGIGTTAQDMADWLDTAVLDVPRLSGMSSFHDFHTALQAAAARALQPSTGFT